LGRGEDHTGAGLRRKGHGMVYAPGGWGLAGKKKRRGRGKQRVRIVTVRGRSATTTSQQARGGRGGGDLEN